MDTRWRHPAVCPGAAVLAALALVYLLTQGEVLTAPAPPLRAGTARPTQRASFPVLRPDCGNTSVPPPGGSCVETDVIGPLGALTVCAPSPNQIHGAGPLALVSYFSWVKTFWAPQPPAAWGLDVGANTGFTSFIPAWLGHTIVAFEPVPVNHQTLAATVCANAAAGKSPGLAGLHLVPAAVGDKAGSLDLWVPKNFGDNAAVNEQAAVGNLGKAVTADKVTVPVVTIDGWLAGHPELNLDPCAAALMKVDVQGYELRVLQGAVSFLTAARGSVTVRAEDDAHLTSLALGKEAVGGVGTLMRGLGYTVREVTAEKDSIWVSDGKGEVPCPRK